MTAAVTTHRIEDETERTLLQVAQAGPPAIAQRLKDLDREWDTDRVIELDAAVTGLTGLLLGALHRRGWLGLTAFVGGAVWLHAVQGWHPLRPLLRRAGVRTAREIARERYALKALRGDFSGLTDGHGGQPTLEAPGQPVESGSANEPEPACQSRLPDTARRVACHTDPAINAALRRRTEGTLMRLQHAAPEAIDAHVVTLEHEWDVERVVQLNASTLVLAGVALGTLVDRRFLLLPAAVLGFFGQHALQGWCPPIPVIRRLGVRTVGEIEREHHAIKALRGDYDELPSADAPDAHARVRSVLRAIDR